MQTSISLSSIHTSHQLANIIIQHLQQQQLNLSDLAIKLGYCSSRVPHAIERLTIILSSGDLGLSDGSFDLKYSRREILYRIFDVLEIAPQIYQTQLDHLVNAVQCKVSKVSYHLHAIIVYGDYQPSYFSRYGIYYKQGYIKVADYFYQLTQYEQSIWLDYHIKQHYDSYKNNLPFGAKIKGYVLIADNTDIEKVYFPCPC